MRRLTNLRTLVRVFPVVGFWYAGVPGAAFAQVPPAASSASRTMAPAAPVEPAPMRSEIERLRAEVEQLRVEYQQRLRMLEEKLGRLEAGTPESLVRRRLEAPSGLSSGTLQVPPPTQQQQPPPPPTDPAPAQPPPTMSSQVFNPDISVIGNFVGVAGKNPFNGAAVAGS